MLSTHLRRILAIEAILLSVGAILLVRAGTVSPAVAAVWGLAAFVGLKPCVIIASYVIARRYAYELPDKLKVSAWTACLAAIGEGLAAFVLFVLIQPFERWWTPADAVGPPEYGRTTVLLIHGYFCNRGLWWWLRRGLRGHGLLVATVNLEAPLSGIDDLADSLHARIKAMELEADGRRVVLVGHSMGGLVARAYMRRYGTGRVVKLITLGSPHHGTELARFGIGQNAREMRPDSNWIRLLSETEPPPVPTVSVWSARDNFIAPQDSSRLAGARDIVLPSLGHLSMAFSPAILRILLREIPDSPLPATGHDRHRS